MKLQKAFLKPMKTLVGEQCVVTTLMLMQPWLLVDSCDWASHCLIVETLQLQETHTTFSICIVMEMSKGSQDVMHTLIIMAPVTTHICNVQVCDLMSFQYIY